MRLTTEQREHMETFIAALRSGNYTQGRGRLVQDNEGQIEHCCLGVACDVMGLEIDNNVFDSEGNPVIGYAAEFETLPSEAQEFFGFPDGNPDIAHFVDVGEGRSVASAAHLNDALSWTFDELADAFENTFLY